MGGGERYRYPPTEEFSNTSVDNHLCFARTMATETESGFIVHARDLNYKNMQLKHPTKIQKNFNFLAHLPFQHRICIQHHKEHRDQLC